MIYCERCGLANREASIYCNACGYELVAEPPESEEPLPPWLRDAAVAGYLWKGEVLLPDWLSHVQPFRELYGGSAVILPPPYNNVDDKPPTPDQPITTERAGEDLAFLDVDDEDGPVEGDLLLLDDLDLGTVADDVAPQVVLVDVTTEDSDAATDSVAPSESPQRSDAAAPTDSVPVEEHEGESILDVLSGVLQEDAPTGSKVMTTVSAADPLDEPTEEPPREISESGAKAKATTETRASAGESAPKPKPPRKARKKKKR